MLKSIMCRKMPLPMTTQAIIKITTIREVLTTTAVQSSASRIAVVLPSLAGIQSYKQATKELSRLAGAQEYSIKVSGR